MEDLKSYAGLPSQSEDIANPMTKMAEDARIDRSELQGRLDRVNKAMECFMRGLREIQVNQEILKAENKALQSTIKDLIETRKNNMQLLKTASGLPKPE